MLQAGAPAAASLTDDDTTESLDSTEETAEEPVDDTTSETTESVDSGTTGDTKDQADSTVDEQQSSANDTVDSNCPHLLSGECSDAGENASSSDEDAEDQDEDCTNDVVSDPCGTEEKGEDAASTAVNQSDCDRDRAESTCTGDGQGLESAALDRAARGDASDVVNWSAEWLKDQDRPICMVLDVFRGLRCEDPPWWLEAMIERIDWPKGDEWRCRAPWGSGPCTEVLVQSPFWVLQKADKTAAAASRTAGEQLQDQSDEVDAAENRARRRVRQTRDRVCSAQERQADLVLQTWGPGGDPIVSASGQTNSQIDDPCETASDTVNSPFFGACDRSAGTSADVAEEEHQAETNTATACEGAASLAYAVCDPAGLAVGVAGQAGDGTGSGQGHFQARGEDTSSTSANDLCRNAAAAAMVAAEMYAESCGADQARLHGTFGEQIHSGKASFAGRADVAAEVAWTGSTEDEKMLCHEDLSGIPDGVELPQAAVEGRIDIKEETAFEMEMRDTFSGEESQPASANVSVEVKLETLGVTPPDEFETGWKDRVNATVEAQGTVILHRSEKNDTWTRLETEVTGVAKTTENGTVSVYVTLTGNTSGFSPFVVATDADHDPKAVFDATPDGLTVSVDASGSSAKDGIAKYEWSFGGQATKTGETVSHTFDSEGTYTVTLTVVDTNGDSATTSKEITVQAGNTGPQVDLTVACTGLTCTFDGSGSSDPDGSVASTAWTFDTGHVADGASVEYTFAAAGSYTVEVTVTDDGGATATETRVVDVQAAPGAGGGSGDGSGDGEGSGDGTGASGDGSDAPPWLPGPIAELAAWMRNPLVLVGMFAAAAVAVGAYLGRRDPRDDLPDAASDDDADAEPGS